jgi:hypothetical protein
MKALRTALVAAVIASGCSMTTTRTVLGMYSGVSILGTEELGFSQPQTTRAIVAETAVITTGIVALLVALQLRDPETATSYDGGGGIESGGGGGGDTSSSGGGDTSSSGAGTTTAANPISGPAGHSIYDRNGAYAGRTDPQGNTYDGNGAFAGHTDAQGNTYNSSGAYAGRVDAQQNYYDRNGAYAGRLDTTGSIYDKNGANNGRIDTNGNIYDKNGALAGHVDGSCDDACKQATAARVLQQ